MAEVFLAVAVGVEGFQRSVVIKRILPHLLEDRAFVNMFIDEAKLCGVMSHPNIVQIFEFGKVRDSFFIAMEHVRGRTLSAVQARLNRIGGQAPIATSLEVMRQVCLGLDYAHGLRSASGQPLGIVHRDVSPSNLMLGLHGGVKILDFGIARVAEELRETHTQVGTMKGKVSYMSPEQARLEPVDNRSDIFSVGIVLHELLTGHRLFKTSSERPSTHLLQEMPVAPPSFANPEVAPEIDRIVMRALAHDPDARFQTAGEMASEIGRLLRDMRAPPDGPERLLGSLFPHEPARSGEVDLALPFAPRFFGDSGSGPSRVSSARTSVGGTPQPSLEVGSGASASAGRQYAARNPAPARRWWIVAGAAALAAIAAAVIAYRLPAPHHRERAVAVAAAPAAAPPSRRCRSRRRRRSQRWRRCRRPSRYRSIRRRRTPRSRTWVRARWSAARRSPSPCHAGTSRSCSAFRRAVVSRSITRSSPTWTKPCASTWSPRASGKRSARRLRIAHRPRAPSRRPSPGRFEPPRRRPMRRAASRSRATARCPSDRFPGPSSGSTGETLASARRWCTTRSRCGAHTLELRRPDLKLVRSVAVILAPDHELKQHYELDSNYSD